jgi:hypothetical protein
MRTHAGTPVPATKGDAPTVDKPTGLEWELSAGYDSHYIFRGERLQENTPWAQLSLDVPLTESLSWNLTPWFLYAPDGDFNEFDFNSTLAYTLGDYELSLGYASYYYPKGAEGGNVGRGDEQECSLGLSRDIGSMTGSVLAVYNLPRDGFYYELKLEQPFVINDTFSVKLSQILALDSHYFDQGTNWNHALTTLEVPVKLSETLTLSPYAAVNVPWGHLDYESTKVFGGVKIAWSF